MMQQRGHFASHAPAPYLFIQLTNFQDLRECVTSLEVIPGTAVRTLVYGMCSLYSLLGS